MLWMLDGEEAAAYDVVGLMASTANDVLIDVKDGQVHLLEDISGYHTTLCAAVGAGLNPG